MEFEAEFERNTSDTDSEISCDLFCEFDQEGEEPQEEPGVIEPYRFEPYLDEDEGASTADGSSSGEESVEADPGEAGVNQNDIPRLGNTDWCLCGMCQPMPTTEESVCCCEQQRVVERRNKHPGIIECITEHEDFHAINLRVGVLETAYYGYRQRYGPIAPGNDWKRYTGYRQFIRWCYFYLGRKIRVPVPSCVVTTIRDTFPQNEYTGFQNAPDDEQ